MNEKFEAYKTAHAAYTNERNMQRINIVNHILSAPEGMTFTAREIAEVFNIPTAAVLLPIRNLVINGVLKKGTEKMLTQYVPVVDGLADYDHPIQVATTHTVYTIRYVNKTTLDDLRDRVKILANCYMV